LSEGPGLVVALVFGIGALLAFGALLAWSSLMWWRWIVQYNRRLFDKDVHSTWPVQFEWRRLEWQELKPGEKLNQTFGSAFLGAAAVTVLASGLSGCVRILMELVGMALR
jgi:ABC-type phosphate/phosphonate transport system permease subunit